MAARDEATDSDGDSELAKRSQRGISPDEELRKSVGVSPVNFRRKLSAVCAITFRLIDEHFPYK